MIVLVLDGDTLGDRVILVVAVVVFVNDGVTEREKGVIIEDTDIVGVGVIVVDSDTVALVVTAVEMVGVGVNEGGHATQVEFPGGLNDV